MSARLTHTNSTSSILDWFPLSMFMLSKPPHKQGARQTTFLSGSKAQGTKWRPTSLEACAGKEQTIAETCCALIGNPYLHYIYHKHKSNRCGKVRATRSQKTLPTCPAQLRHEPALRLADMEHALQNLIHMHNSAKEPSTAEHSDTAADNK